MNLVLDTNVLISAFIGKGFCHSLLEHCLCVHSCITSEFILNEVREKLMEKFKYSDESVKLHANLQTFSQGIDTR